MWAGCGRSGTAARPALLVHEPRAERALGQVLVVGAAEQSHIVDRRLASSCELVHVVELEHPPGLAAPAGRADVGAPALVALPDLPKAPRGNGLHSGSVAEMPRGISGDLLDPLIGFGLGK